MTDLLNTNLCNISINVFYNAKSRNSFCWRYFGNLVTTERNKKKIHNPDKVYCSACLNTVKQQSEDITFGSVKIKQYNRTVSTGNLNRHLRDDHHIQEEYHTEIKDELKIKDGQSSANKVKFNFKTRSKKTSCFKGQIARDLALWHCNSLIPFDSVTDVAMLDFLKKYNVVLTEEDLPSQHTIRDWALTNEYEFMLAKVKENIATDSAQQFAMTFELWTDQYRRLNYITFKLHYLTSDFNLRAWTLGTKILNGEPTGKNINFALEDIRDTFELDGKKIVATTDIGNNLEQSFATHHTCIGHSLQNLITVDGIQSVPEITNTVQKCKEILTVLRYHIPELQAETENKEQHLDFLNRVDEVVKMLEIDEFHPIPQIKLFDENDDIKHMSFNSIQITPTKVSSIRWQIVLEMLKTVIYKYNHANINSILKQINQENLSISMSEWVLLEELAKFLKSFRDTVEIMILVTAQNLCTLNVVLLFRSELIDLLKLPQDESPNMLTLKHNMMQNLNRRFPVTKTLVAAALLDSRFLSLKEIDTFLEKYNTTRPSFLSTYIKEKEIIIDNELPESIAGTSNSIINNDNKNDVLLQILSKKHSVNANQSLQNDPIQQECVRYIAAADPSEPKDGNLLSLWNSKKEAFPYLAALAKALLCIPATSISSERMFSAADLDFTAKKSRLSPITVNKILFIHENYKACNTDEKH